MYKIFCLLIIFIDQGPNVYMRSVEHDDRKNEHDHQSNIDEMIQIKRESFYSNPEWEPIEPYPQPEGWVPEPERPFQHIKMTTTSSTSMMTPPITGPQLPQYRRHNPLRPSSRRHSPQPLEHLRQLLKQR